MSPRPVRSFASTDADQTRHEPPAVAPRGRPRSEQARDAILRSTLALLERHGLDGLTIEDIAGEAKVGKATIYRWWSSRLAVVLDAMELLPELEPRDLGSFAADVRALLVDLAELLTSTPLGGVLAHLAGDASTREPEVHEYLERRMAGGLAVVARAVARGELPDETDAASVMYLTVGPVINRCFFGPPVDDAYIDLVVATITAGLPLALAPIPRPRRRSR